MQALKILVIDDEQLIRWSFEKKLKAQGYIVLSADSGEAGLRLFESEFPDIVFVDNKLPGIQGLEVISRIRAISEDSNIVFMTAYGSIDTAVKAMKLGAQEYVNKPFSFPEIYAIIDSISEKIRISNEVHLLRRQNPDKLTFDHIVGISPEIRSIIQLSNKIAKINTTTVLLLGESGTGKDLFARAIHNESSRSKKPFVTINCSSLPETLMESELFGHEQGAFTDAKKLKKGLFEMADGGTVFLDEIGEINLITQVKLLGVIENRVIRRLSGIVDIPVDIRIIAATNKDLRRSIQEKGFREDLYYRLTVFQITIPPLREHAEDIALLSDHFLSHFNAKFRKNVKLIEPEAKQFLGKYDWPGNIRELRNVIERAVILETGDVIRAESLPSEIIRSGRVKVLNQEETDKSEGFFSEGASLYDLEKQTISAALKKSGNNQTRASRLLGITRDTLRYKIKKYHL
ncbi:MAG: sigma-54-dependent transcriptional regulator [Bacteroidales bacterium]